jgi:hypothetical protein
MAPKFAIVSNLWHAENDFERHHLPVIAHRPISLCLAARAGSAIRPAPEMWRRMATLSIRSVNDSSSHPTTLRTALSD